MPLIPFHSIAHQKPILPLKIAAYHWLMFGWFLAKNRLSLLKTTDLNFFLVKLARERALVASFDATVFLQQSVQNGTAHRITNMPTRINKRLNEHSTLQLLHAWSLNMDKPRKIPVFSWQSLLVFSGFRSAIFRNLAIIANAVAAALITGRLDTKDLVHVKRKCCPHGLSSNPVFHSLFYGSASVLHGVLQTRQKWVRALLMTPISSGKLNKNCLF